jgi:hypothetical protein
MPLKRRQTQEIVARDPWLIQVSRTEKDASDDPGLTQWTFVGSVKSSGPYRGIEQGSRTLNAANPVSTINFCLIAAHGEVCPRARDRIIATQTLTGVTKKFLVISGSTYGYKIEVMLNEVQ